MASLVRRQHWRLAQQDDGDPAISGESRIVGIERFRGRLAAHLVDPIRIDTGRLKDLA